MKFTRKLITPVLATVLLIGGAAFAQDKVMDVIAESDGEAQDGWLFDWRYDAETGEFTWGDPDCVSPPEDSTPVESDPDGLAEASESTNSNCYTLDLATPQPPDDEDSDGSDETNHGDLVSGIAHQVKDLDKDELPEDAENRGSVISDLARSTQDLFKGDDDADDSETEIEEVEDEDEDESEENSDKPDKPDKEPPAKAKGKNK